VDWLEAINNPEDESMGTRKVPFSRELYIERDDFMENPPKKYFRLAPGQEVRLRYAYFIKCDEIVKDSAGNITELKCTYDPATKGGNAPNGRKVKGTIHWVSVPHAIKAEARLYERLFVKENPEDAGDECDFKVNLNPDSLIVQDCFAEPFVKDLKVMDKFQFERVGYFCVDSDSKAGQLVFNRTVTLKDSWAKIVGKNE
jgi:glutaminyl-tRNA synthetase